MPTSAYEHVDWAVNRINALNPYRILDVGPGEGKWVSLARQPGQYWTGLEIFPRYVVDYGLHEKYDRIVVDDVRSSADLLRENEFIIFGDVLEHLERDEAQGIVDYVRSQGRGMLVTGPIIHFPQGEWEGNVHETHLWDPTAADWISMVQPDEFILGEVVGLFWVNPG